MIKLIATGVLVLVMTLGGVFAAVKFGQPPADDHKVDAPPPPQYVQGDLLTLPVLSNGAVAGYFLIRSTLLVDSVIMKDVKAPMTAYMTDELFGLLVGDKILDVKEVGKFDVAGFKTKIKDGINARMEKPLVRDVMIQQMDYITKEILDARDSTRKPQKIVINTDPEPPKAAAASPSH